MAAIDKIYGTNEQYDELRTWLKANKPEYLRYLYPREAQSAVDRSISNFPEDADRWLLERCPLKWVDQRIREQYKLQPGEKWRRP